MSVEKAVARPASTGEQTAPAVELLAAMGRALVEWPELDRLEALAVSLVSAMTGSSQVVLTEFGPSGPVVRARHGSEDGGAYPSNGPALPSPATTETSSLDGQARS